MNKPNLLVIDLDKTLISVNSSRLILRRLLGIFNFSLFFYCILRVLRLINREQFARVFTIATERFFQKNEVSRFVEELKAYLCEDVQDIIESHVCNGDRVLVISASPHIYVQEFAAQLGFIGIGSYLTEKYEFVHMYSVNKLEYLKCYYPQDSYNYWFAISDSASDAVLLKDFERAYLVRDSKIVKF